MDYQGPEAADLANVYSLNRAWLDELRRHGSTLSGAMPGTFDVVPKLAALSVARAGLLSGCPFLIFALPEAAVLRGRARVLDSSAKNGGRAGELRIIVNDGGGTPHLRIRV